MWLNMNEFRTWPRMHGPCVYLHEPRAWSPRDSMMERLRWLGCLSCDSRCRGFESHHPPHPKAPRRTPIRAFLRPGPEGALQGGLGA